MIDTIAVDATPGEMRVALIAEGRTVELLYRRAGRESRVGGVYLGRVTRVAPGLDAAFVEIGAGRAGFLDAPDARPDPQAPIGAIGDHVQEGAAVLVQVARDAVGDKGPKLTRRLALPGRFLVLAPGQPGIRASRRIADDAEAARLTRIAQRLARPGDGLAPRTAASGASEDALATDARALYALWDGIEAARGEARPPALLHDDSDPLVRALRDRVGAPPQWRLGRIVAEAGPAAVAARAARARLGDDAISLPAIEIDDGGGAPLFERLGVEDAIEDALSPLIPLPSGARLAIEETEALTAIDVDTGLGGSAGGETTTLRANLEAAAEIGPALRLRGIGGLVVIDFARLRRVDHRRRVLAALNKALASDPAAGRAFGFSRLGLVELARRRIGPSLSELLCEPRPPAADRRRAKSAETVANEIARALVRAARTARPGPLAVTAAPEVARLLADPGGPFAGLERALGRALALAPTSDGGRETFEITAG